MKVAIIGAGEMGEWFAKILKREGWDITITDEDLEKAKKVAKNLKVNYEKNNLTAAEGSKIIIVSVPIKKTPKIVKKIGQKINKNTLLMDIASVKTPTVETMKNLDTEAEVASLHPLFGPGAKNFENQNIATIEVKTGKIYEEFIKFLSNSGANLVKIGAEEHDKATAITQALTHFTLINFLSALQSMENPEVTEELSTPMFEKLTEVSKAFLNVEPKICGDIQTENKFAKNARKAIVKSSKSLEKNLENGKTGKIEKIFEKSRETIGIETIKSTYEKIYEEKDE